ncbi:MAG TPA: hypothetical protein PLF25_04910 [Accumulibacter sp.]|jgi:hypothetical protein|nr:hypothetical protein [Accumulibacter sp.]
MTRRHFVYIRFYPLITFTAFFLSFETNSDELLQHFIFEPEHSISCGTIIMNYSRFPFLLACFFYPAMAMANCYIIYDNNGKAIYQSSQSPIDLSKSVSHEMNTRHKNRHLVILTEVKGCADLGGRAEANAGKSSANRTTVVSDVDYVLEKSPLFRKRITFLGDDH